MELNKQLSKAQLKLRDKQREAVINETEQLRNVFVGDDTGLLKKLQMSFSVTDHIISEPSKSTHRKKRLALDQEDATTDEVAKEVNRLEEEAVIRQRPQVEFKLLAKTGQQVKDEGLLYLRWSIQDQASTCLDYISYVRGKSNVINVFDTQTENVLFSKKYDV